jgi:predicted Zn-dependent protease
MRLPSRSPPSPTIRPALVLDARLKASGGDVPGALALVESTLAKAPTLTEGWQLKGELLLSQKQVEPALAAFRSALETKPDQVLPHYMIVTVLLQNGKNEEARKQLEAMQKALPKNPQTFYLQALIAYQDKNYAGAREAIQQHLKVSPTASWACCWARKSTTSSGPTSRRRPPCSCCCAKCRNTNMRAGCWFNRICAKASRTRRSRR